MQSEKLKRFSDSGESIAVGELLVVVVVVRTSVEVVVDFWSE